MNMQIDLAVPEAGGNPDAKRLYEDLLIDNGYNKLIRPVGNNSDKLTVKLGLRLSQLIDVVSGPASHTCAISTLAPCLLSYLSMSLTFSEESN